MNPTAARLIKSWLGPHGTTRARCLVKGKPLPRWGNLRRTTPLSEQFGADRGTPIDRYYLHRFMERHRASITGEVLEVQLASYAKLFGQKVTRVDTFDIDPRFQPTFVCDLGDADAVLPASRYDCVLLPNTLHHLRLIAASLRQLLRVLKPGGVALASACGLVPLIPDGPDYWHLSEEGWREVTSGALAGHEVQVEAHGNCLAAVAAMMGIAVEEVTAAELDQHDRRYPVLITVFCRKSRAAPA